MRSGYIRLLILSLILVCGLVTVTPGQAPVTITYQGRLLLSSGDPVTTARSVTFSLYTSETGGTPIWSESHTVTPDELGIFTVELGSVLPFAPAVLSGTRRYLGLQVASDTEMSPRQLLGSVPYALQVSRLANDIVGTDNIQDNSVTSDKVPDAGLSSADIADGPGLVNASSAVDRFLLGTSMVTLLSDTIQCPDSGYVMAIAVGELFVGHIAGTSSWASFGVSPDQAAFPEAQGIREWVSSGAPDGTFIRSVTSHGVFPVGPGDNIFYFLAQRGDGAGQLLMDEIQLSLLYIPTAYGTAVSAAQSSVDNNNQSAEFGNGASESEDLRQQLEDLRREMDTRIADLQRRLDSMSGERK